MSFRVRDRDAEDVKEKISVIGLKFYDRGFFDFAFGVRFVRLVTGDKWVEGFFTSTSTPEVRAIFERPRVIIPTGIDSSFCCWSPSPITSSKNSAFRFLESDEDATAVVAVSSDTERLGS